MVYQSQPEVTSRHETQSHQGDTTIILRGRGAPPTRSLTERSAIIIIIYLQCATTSRLTVLHQFVLMKNET